MAKALKNNNIKKESFMQGVITLMLSQGIIKILGLIYTLYLTNREGYGDAGNAISVGAYQVYGLLLTISSIGVPNAVSKLVAEKIAIGDHKGANKIFKIAFVTFSILGLIGSFILFFGAKVISKYWLSIPEAELTLVSLSPAIFFVSISAVMRGYFNGRQNIKITANSQSVEQMFKMVLTIIFVEIVAISSNAKTELMAAGANLATTAATFMCFTYLFMYYREQRNEIGTEIYGTINYKYEKIFTVIKNILEVSIPMTITAVMVAINKNIDSFTVVRGLKKYMEEAEAKIQYGILSGKVETITTMPVSINIAFSTALIPAISAAIAKKDRRTATSRITFSLLISMIIGLPCALGTCVYSSQILNLLFPNANQGATLLKISAFTIVFIMLEQTINGSLQGLGKNLIPAKALALGMIAKLILNITLIKIPQIGINAAAIGTLICHIISFLVVSKELKKNIQINMSFMQLILKPIIATFIMITISYTFFTILNRIITQRLATILTLIIAVVIYILAILVLKIFKKEEFSMLPYGNKLYNFLEKIKIY